MPVTADNADAVAVLTKALLRPFDLGEVKFKPQSVKGNRALAIGYIDARHVMDRLDDELGIDGWRDEYTVLPGGEVECRLSLRIAGTWITKADVGSPSEQPDGGDRMKAAYSDALKRAAVKFGVGRFLYRTGHAWHDYDPQKKQFAHPLKLVPHGDGFRVVAASETETRVAAQPAAKPAPQHAPPTVASLLASLNDAQDPARVKAITDHIAGRPDIPPATKTQHLRPAVEAARQRLGMDAPKSNAAPAGKA
jgi:hypothetical protein